ncbi:MAG: hypothetical protein IJF67_08150 [Clostridia bacterium]|nr:hypothetical protein [Clostridia bacterium]
MTELEKIAYAKNFLDQMANGVNPLDGSFIPEDELLRHRRIEGCMRYVSEILGELIAQGGIKPARKPRTPKTVFAMSPEMLEKIEYSATPIPITELLRPLNDMRGEGMKRITARSVGVWLVTIGALETVEDNLGRKHKRPTEAGRALGISMETRVSDRGEYPIVVYNAAAQQFIVENLYEILASETPEDA